MFSRDPASSEQEEDGGAEQAEARSSASAGDARATRARRPGTVKDAEEDSSEEGEDAVHIVEGLEAGNHDVTVHVKEVEGVSIQETPTIGITLKVK